MSTLPLFPASVVGSIPRPLHVRELIDKPDWDAADERTMDAAVRYVISMQEMAGLEQHPLALPAHAEKIERAQRRIRLTLRVAKGREIVAANQILRRRVHGRDIERRPHQPRAPARKRQRRATVDDLIAIVPRHRAAPGVEIRRRGLG